MAKFDNTIAAALLSFDTFMDYQARQLIDDFDPSTLRNLRDLGYVTVGRRWVTLTDLGYSARDFVIKQQGRK